MDAIVELQYERLNSIQLSDLAPLPNARKLISRIRGLEQTVYEILPAVPVVLRQTGTNGEVVEEMQSMRKLAIQLESLLNDLESEAISARSSLTGCFTATTLFCLRRFPKRLAVITAGFRKLTPYFGSSEQSKTISWRGDDVDVIVERLLSHNDQTVAVHCIVGSPGIGKTALASLAYEDARLQQVSDFNVRAWLLVSRNFNAERVIQDLSQKLGTTKKKLGAYLSRKRFLFVLDHMCEVDSSNWGNFTAYLSSAAKGSKVLVTMTPEAYDAACPHVISMRKYELNGLKKKDWLFLFTSMAFPADRNPEEDLVSIAKDTVNECDGNPRAINLVAEILKDKKTEAEWKKVLYAGINLDLLIAYDKLTPTWKLCFVYCFILPKDYKVCKETLIQLWIAQDLVGKTSGAASLEANAGKYFIELASKQFLHDSTEEEGIYMIPDYNNLARFMAGKEYLQYISDTSFADYVPENIRHISCNYDLSVNLGALLHYTNLRTLLLVCSPATRPAIFSDQANLDKLLTKIPELKTLSLSGLPIRTIPDSIRNLKRLQFLDVSHTLIEKLPYTITSSCNSLLTLKLNDCVRLTELASVEKQIKLRHLDISGSSNIRAMPRGTGGLTNLNSLSNFIVRYANGSHIKELRNLVNLSGKLCISGLQNVLDSRDAMEANLAGKELLTELVLEWTSEFGGRRYEKVVTEVLGHLKASSNLEALRIIRYGGTRFPEWISHSNKLVSVTLSNCRNCDSLPLLGQLPLLKVLSIEGMDEVKRIGVEFCGEVATFRSLETLEFKNMPYWEEWSFSTTKKLKVDLPRLRSLRLERCPILKELNVPMEELELLTVKDCQQLTTFSLAKFPKLLEIDIQHCSNLKNLPDSIPTLTKLRIWGCQNLTSLWKIHPAGIPHLVELDIENCTRLMVLPENLPQLKKLRITKCRELVFNVSTCPDLVDFILEECNRLTLSNEFEMISLNSMVISQPPNYEYPLAQLFRRLSSGLLNLEISKFANLEALTEKNEHGEENSLERLVIDGCPKLKQLPADIFACLTSLKKLVVVGCEALECFPETALMHPALKHLEIGKCKHLKSLPLNIFDSKVLEYLHVYSCPSLASISGNRNNLPQSLTSLSISRCTSLESLPAGINRRNAALTSLRIHDCNSVKDFPRHGFPCNITSLSVTNCRKLKPLSEWELHKLECLRKFSFERCTKLVNLEGVKLPNSVGFLLLRGLSELKSLTGLLVGLDSLDSLTIRDCPKLFEIMTTEEEKLPLISCLNVSNCPIFIERCQNEDWPKIEHIPLIEFDFHPYVRKIR